VPDDGTDLVTAEAREGWHHPTGAPFTQGCTQIIVAGNSKKILKIQRDSNAAITFYAMANGTIPLV
jgi:hypothetical protein